MPSPQIRFGPEDTATAMGMRGSGKTSLFRHLLPAFKPNLVVWDPLAQYPPDVSYRPGALSRRELDSLCRQLWPRAPINLMLEEAEQVLPQGMDLPPACKQFFLMGRNVGARWLVNTRQPQALTKRVLDESDHFFIFKLQGRALDYMMRYLGRDGRRLAKMQAWRKEQHRFFWYHDALLEECEALELAPAPKGAVRAAR